MSKNLCIATTCAALLVASSGLAHHSRHATYDPDDRVALAGTITKVEWRNPHVWLFLDVADERGATMAWACETASPITLFRRGWRPDSLKPGDVVTINGEKARNGTANCNVRSVTLADGRAIFGGDAGSVGDPGGGE